MATGAAALMAAGLLAGGSGVPASATTTWHPGHICSAETDGGCLRGNGSGNPVTAQSGGDLTNFKEISEGTWQGHPMHEYQQANTTLCLQWQYKSGSTVVNYVRLASCNAGAAELWYWNSNDQIISEDWNSYFGTQGCIEDPRPTQDVYVGTCDITMQDQMWSASNGT
jgi:hypothetical protein